MDFDSLSKMLLPQLESRIKNHAGLAICASERAKFEGWLKVELCDILSSHFNDVQPEGQRFDVVFGDWAIELKTPNTNYRYDSVKNKHRPITNNIDGILEDIEKLRSAPFKNKAVLFVAFPVESSNPNWQAHLIRLQNSLKKLNHVDLHFNNGIPAAIYFGSV